MVLLIDIMAMQSSIIITQGMISYFAILSHKLALQLCFLPTPLLLLILRKLIEIWNESEVFSNFVPVFTCNHKQNVVFSLSFTPLLGPQRLKELVARVIDVTNLLIKTRS